LDVYHAWKHALKVRLEELRKDTKDYLPSKELVSIHKKDILTWAQQRHGADRPESGPPAQTGR
jgi:hypothetical protein